MTLGELAAATGLDKSAVQRLVHTLVSIGYLERCESGVAPGRKILDRSYDYLRSNPLVGSAIPVLDDLKSSIGERVDLLLFDDVEMIYAVRMQSKRSTSYTHFIGRRVPTFCSSGGRAVLAKLPREEVIDILQRSNLRKYTPSTTTEVEKILEVVEHARSTGYAIAIEEILVGEMSVSAAVLDAQNRPIGAIQVAASLADWEPEKFILRAGPLAATAAESLRQQ